MVNSSVKPSENGTNNRVGVRQTRDKDKLRLEIIPTPKHGSWLNIAEHELSALTRQCVKGCRFATIEELREVIEEWMKQCNEKQKGVIWQFNCEKARIKLHDLYPKNKN